MTREKSDFKVFNLDDNRKHQIIETFFAEIITAFIDTVSKNSIFEKKTIETLVRMNFKIEDFLKTLTSIKGQTKEPKKFFSRVLIYNYIIPVATVMITQMAPRLVGLSFFKNEAALESAIKVFNADKGLLTDPIIIEENDEK